MNEQEIVLNENQLRALDKLGKKAAESRIGRFFDWIDTNILSKTTRLWMYFLEIMGCVTIFIILYKFTAGLNMIALADTELALKKAQLYVEAVEKLTPAIAAMVATICGALPGVMATFQTLKKKWANGTSSHKEPNGIQ